MAQKTQKTSSTTRERLTGILHFSESALSILSDMAEEEIIGNDNPVYMNEVLSRDLDAHARSRRKRSSFSEKQRQYIVTDDGQFFRVSDEVDEEPCRQGYRVSFYSPPKTGKWRWAKNIKLL